MFYFKLGSVYLTVKNTTPKQLGPRPNQTEICFTFVSNPPVSWGSCRVLSQLDKCTAASAALNGQSEIETEPTRGVHLTFNPSHKTLLVLLYSISPQKMLSFMATICKVGSVGAFKREILAVCWPFGYNGPRIEFSTAILSSGDFSSLLGANW